jgi:hypothetical protein
VRALVSAVHICVIEASSYHSTLTCVRTQQTDSETTKLAGSISKEGGPSTALLSEATASRHLEIAWLSSEDTSSPFLSYVRGQILAPP